MHNIHIYIYIQVCILYIYIITLKQIKYGMFMYVQRLFPSSEQVCEDVLSYYPSSTSGCWNTRGKLQGPASSPLHQRVLFMRRHSIQDDLLKIQDDLEILWIFLGWFFGLNLLNSPMKLTWKKTKQGKLWEWCPLQFPSFQRFFFEWIG